MWTKSSKSQILQVRLLERTHDYTPAAVAVFRKNWPHTRHSSKQSPASIAINNHSSFQWRCLSLLVPRSYAGLAMFPAFFLTHISTRSRKETKKVSVCPLQLFQFLTHLVHLPNFRKRTNHDSQYKDRTEATWRKCLEASGGCYLLVLFSFHAPCCPVQNLDFLNAFRSTWPKNHSQPLLLAWLARAPCSGTWENSVIHGKSPNLDSFWRSNFKSKVYGPVSMLSLLLQGGGRQHAFHRGGHIWSDIPKQPYSERSPGLTSEAEGKGQRLSTAPAP